MSCNFVSPCVQGNVSKFANDFTSTSPLMEAWLAELSAAGITNTEGTRGVEAALAVKDDAALEQVTKAGHLTARVARNAFIKEMERVIQDEDKSATNASIAAKVTASVDDLKVRRSRCLLSFLCVYVCCMVGRPVDGPITLRVYPSEAFTCISASASAFPIASAVAGHQAGHGQL